MNSTTHRNSALNFQPLLIGVAVAMALPHSLVANEVASRFERPDILFILLDDLRWDAMSFMGHPYIETPHIDGLRERGAHMANAFVSTSICCPSRATFLTGTLASRHGVIDNESAEYDPEVTPPLTKYLNEVGYHTAMIGKWHMGYHGQPRPHFDYWLSFDGQGVYHDPVFNINGEEVGQKGYTTDLLTDRTIDFIKEQPKDEPYFVMLSHKAVHEPFEPAPRHLTVFGADTKDPKPESWSDDFAGKPLWLRRDGSRDVRWEYRTRDYENENVPDLIPPEEWQESNKYVDQLRCAAAVDDGLGRIIEMLRERGTLDQTLIVFTSDNGYFHLEHRRWDKRLAYEESVRIPMIVVYPAVVPPGSTVNQLVTNADFAPTVLDFAGISIPRLMQGRSMKPLFKNKDTEWRDTVFYEYWKDLVHSIPTMTAVRGERYKLIRTPMLDDISELYDLKEDPHEMDNLYLDPDYALVREKMKMQLRAEELTAGWKSEIIPKNYPEIRGQAGVLLDLGVRDERWVDQADSGLELVSDAIEVLPESIRFNGKGSSFRIPYSLNLDPSGYPYRIDLTIKPESDGVIAVQASTGYGYKIFVQNGRPGIAVRCTTWIATTTTIDGPNSILGRWTNLQALIDYNRLTFLVDGVVAESIELPMPFKVPTGAPLIFGRSGAHVVASGLPDSPFSGEIRRFTVQRARFQ